MLWLILKQASHQIMSCNVHNDVDKEGNSIYQLWITRPNGKSLKIEENKEKKFIEEIKNAIDFAIENKEPALRLA